MLALGFLFLDVGFQWFAVVLLCYKKTKILFSKKKKHSLHMQTTPDDDL